MRNKAEAGNPDGNEILAEFSDVVESLLLGVFLNQAKYLTNRHALVQVGLLCREPHYLVRFTAYNNIEVERLDR